MPSLGHVYRAYYAPSHGSSAKGPQAGPHKHHTLQDCILMLSCLRQATQCCTGFEAATYLKECDILLPERP